MKIFDEIIQLYVEINKIYCEILKLDNSGTKENNYFALLDELNEKLEQEKELLDSYVSKYGTSVERICVVRNKLTEVYGIHFSQRLSNYLSNYNSISVNVYDTEKIRQLDEILRLDILMMYCSRNIIKIYLSFLQEQIDNVSDKELRNRLNLFKYGNSFVNHDVESQLMDSRFEVSRNNSIDLYEVANLLEMSSDICDDMLLSYCIDMIKMSIKRLASISDLEYNDVESEALSINYQCMLKASLSLLSDKDYSMLEEDILDDMYLLLNGENNKSISIIISLLGERAKYKSRVRNIGNK